MRKIVVIASCCVLALLGIVYQQSSASAADTNLIDKAGVEQLIKGIDQVVVSSEASTSRSAKIDSVGAALSASARKMVDERIASEAKLNAFMRENHPAEATTRIESKLVSTQTVHDSGDTLVVEQSYDKIHYLGNSIEKGATWSQILPYEVTVDKKTGAIVRLVVKDELWQAENHDPNWHLKAPNT